MTELTKNEKELIVSILEKHLEEVKKTEKLVNQDLLEFAAEVEYDKFLETIIKKLS